MFLAEHLDEVWCRAMCFNSGKVTNRKIFKVQICERIMKKQKYQPTRNEIIKSMIKDIENPLKEFGKSIYEIGKEAFSFVKYLVESALYVNTIPYHLPTFGRKIANMKKGPIGSDSEQLGFSIGFLGGIIGGTIGQFALYDSLSDKTNFPLWAIPVTTNVISGIYEIGKEINKKYKNTKEKLILEKAKSLEHFVKTSA